MKKGVTMSVILVAIVIMMILITSASVVGSGAIASANFEEFKSGISRVADAVNAYEIANGKLPIKNEVISADSLGANFYTELSMRNDKEKKLFVVDLSLLNDPTIRTGKGSVANQDVFVVSEGSKNVYYLKGYRYKKKYYYGIQNDSAIHNEVSDEKVIPGVVVKKDSLYTDPAGKTAMIPKGFKVSTVLTEQNIDNGLVILAPDDSEFVWIPVDNVASYIDKTNQRSNLTDWSTETSILGTPITYNASGYREPDIVSTPDNNIQNLGKINTILGTSLTTGALLKTYLLQEWKDIYTSIEQYKGFYIGRYETGNLSGTNVVSKKANTDIWNNNNLLWYTMYAKQKKYATSLNGVTVKSNMIYGFQWDATMKWFANSTNTTVKNFPIRATDEYANFSSSKKPTGTLKPINNIYDIAGNAVEWTAEAYSVVSRTSRGGAYNYTDYAQCAGYRTYTSGAANGEEYYGTRMALYL